MSRRASMSAEAIENRMNRDQTSGDALDIAEIIAVRFDVAIGMTKQEGFPHYQKRGEIRVRELELQLRSLANWADAGYPDEYKACFHIEEGPLMMRLHNVPAELLQDITDELARQDEWLDEPATVAEATAAAYGALDLGTRMIISGGEVLELDTPQTPEDNDEEYQDEDDGYQIFLSEYGDR